MAEIFELLLNNLASVGIGVGIFLLSYIANICFSVYYNIKVLGQRFNREQAVNSLLKLITFAVGCSCLVVVVTALPLFASFVGLPLPEEFTNNITMIAIVGFPLYAASKYALMAFDKMKKVLESGTITLHEFENTIAEASKKENEGKEQTIEVILNSIKDSWGDFQDNIGKEIAETIEKSREKEKHDMKEYVDLALKEEAGAPDDIPVLSGVPDEVDFEKMKENQIID